MRVWPLSALHDRRVGRGTFVTLRGDRRSPRLRSPGTQRIDHVETTMARLPENLFDRLRSRPQTGVGYWTVVVRLWDGREVGGVAIIDGDIVQTIDRTPIQPAEIVNLGMDNGEWLFNEGVTPS